MRTVFLDPLKDKQFWEDGFVVLDLLEDQATQDLSKAWRCPEDIKDAGWRLSFFSADIEARKALSALVCGTLGGALTVHLDRYIHRHGYFATKVANHPGSDVEMHYHPTFVDESRYASLVIFCPLVDTHEENGCLYVTPGSHLIDANPRYLGIPFPYKELEPYIRDHFSHPLHLKAGQAVVFHSGLYHFSGPNQTDVERVAVAMNGMPVECEPRIYMKDPQQALIHAFDVSHEFLLNIQYGDQIGDLKPVETRPWVIEPLDKERLDRLLGSGAS